MKTVLKVLTALVTIAGVVYVIAAYGDKIVATCKKLTSWFCDRDGVQVVIESDFAPETTSQTPAEAPADAAPVTDETTPVANEDDFEG